MSRPDTKDIFAKKPGIFAWMRDRAYDVVYYELGTGLDFVGDLFRGPSGYSQSLHRQAEKAQKRTPQARPLTQAEQAVFVGLLKRKTSEPQMAYWKRKKALLSNPEKQGLVAQQRALDAAMDRQRAKTPANITVEATSQSPFRAQSKTQAKARSRR